MNFIRPGLLNEVMNNTVRNRKSLLYIQYISLHTYVMYGNGRLSPHDMVYARRHPPLLLSMYIFTDILQYGVSVVNARSMYVDNNNIIIINN